MKKFIWIPLIIIGALVIYIVSNQSLDESGTSRSSSQTDTVTKTQSEKRDMLDNGYEEVDGRMYYKLPERPFKVVKESEHFAWTGEDCVRQENIQLLANNQLRFEHFMYQNNYALRRQLVYVKEPFSKQGPDLISGASRDVKIPLLDGNQLALEVDPEYLQVHYDNDEEGQLLGFMHEGNDKTVNGGYANGAWVFYVDFSNGVSYHVEERIPGELIVTEIDKAAQMRLENQDHSHTTPRSPAAVGTPR